MHKHATVANDILCKLIARNVRQAMLTLCLFYPLLNLLLPVQSHVLKRNEQPSMVNMINRIPTPTLEITTPAVRNPGVRVELEPDVNGDESNNIRSNCCML